MAKIKRKGERRYPCLTPVRISNESDTYSWPSWETDICSLIRYYPITPLEHRAPTNFLHSILSCASHLSSFHVLPIFDLSSSTVLLQVPLGLPLFLLPCGFQLRAISGWRFLFIRRTCPSHLQRLPWTSSTIQFIPVFDAISLLVTLCSHHIPKILRRHLPSKPLNLLSICLLVRHASQAYSKTDLTLS